MHTETLGNPQTSGALHVCSKVTMRRLSTFVPLQRRTAPAWVRKGGGGQRALPAAAARSTSTHILACTGDDMLSLKAAWWRLEAAVPKARRRQLCARRPRFAVTLEFAVCWLDPRASARPRLAPVPYRPWTSEARHPLRALAPHPRISPSPSALPPLCLPAALCTHRSSAHDNPHVTDSGELQQPRRCRTCSAVAMCCCSLLERPPVAIGCSRSVVCAHPLLASHLRPISHHSQWIQRSTLFAG